MIKKSTKKIYLSITEHDGDLKKVANDFQLTVEQLEKIIVKSKKLTEFIIEVKKKKKESLVNDSIKTLNYSLNLKKTNPAIALKAACYVLDNLRDGTDFGEKVKNNDEFDEASVHQDLNNYISINLHPEKK